MSGPGHILIPELGCQGSWLSQGGHTFLSPMLWGVRSGEITVIHRKIKGFPQSSDVISSLASH